MRKIGCQVKRDLEVDDSFMDMAVFLKTFTYVVFDRTMTGAGIGLGGYGKERSPK